MDINYSEKNKKSFYFSPHKKKYFTYQKCGSAGLLANQQDKTGQKSEHDIKLQGGLTQSTLCESKRIRLTHFAIL